MTDALIIQYVGFEPMALVRVYTFSVRAAAAEPREFTLTIANEAFDSHRARYQDAPDICSVRLRRELVAGAERSLITHFRVTDAELDAYRTAHSPKSSRNLFSPKPKQDF